MTYRIISADEVPGMERLVRIPLIKSVAAMKSAKLLGTVDEGGQANLALFNSVVQIGANPPGYTRWARPFTRLALFPPRATRPLIEARPLVRAVSRGSRTGPILGSTRSGYGPASGNEIPLGDILLFI